MVKDVGSMCHGYRIYTLQDMKVSVDLCAFVEVYLLQVYKMKSRQKEFYDRMIVHPNRFLVNKTNRCTEFQFYWYYDSTCFGQPFCS